MPVMKDINLSDLIVNTENYRFETLASQKEAIDRMVTDQGENLYNLAEHITENGLNPNDRLQVVVSNHDPKKYIVLEGNRRAVSLKLLKQPDLIDIPHFSGLKRKFLSLYEKNTHRALNEIPCTIYKDAKDADVWIGIKHGYGKTGIATESWGALQKQRFGEKTEGKTSVTIQIINKLKNSEKVPNEIKNNLENINTSNLDRLINDPDVRSFLGIQINNGLLQSEIDESEVIKGLTRVVKDILDPNFKVKKIYDKNDRLDYIKNFPKTETPSLKNKAAQPWRFNGENRESNASRKRHSDPKERTRLIPKSCILSISNPKVNSIYYELQALDVSRYTNAVAVLFRVFVELSADSYIEKHKLCQSLSAAKSTLSLQTKINTVANHLETKKVADAAICKGIKSAIKDPNDILGIDTWHAYVHNNRFSPKSSNLILTWDSMQDFIRILWDGVK